MAGGHLEKGGGPAARGRSRDHANKNHVQMECAVAGGILCWGRGDRMYRQVLYRLETRDLVKE